jgi:hypothetical protein
MSRWRITIAPGVTPLIGPASLGALPVVRRVLILVACLIAYLAAAAVLNAMPTVFRP